MNAAGPLSLVLLMQFGPKLIPYQSLLVQTLQSAWQNHPSIYVALPCRSSAAADSSVIVCQHTGWVSMLRESLAHIKHHERNVRYVLSVIDDHCPLRFCDERRLARIIRTAITEEMKCVVFPTYEWPWMITAENSVDERGRTMTWNAIDVLETNGCRFARVPKDFFRYNQCQPGIWDIDYYLSVCDRALELGIDDAWEFESMLLPNQPQHYVSEYSWPSVHHGFMAQGQVNVEAIHFARGDSAQMKALRELLVQEYCSARGRWAYVTERLKRSLRPARRLLSSCLRALGVLRFRALSRGRLRPNGRAS